MRIKNQTPDTVMAWHFVGDALRDGRPIPADGEWLGHEGEVVICESGLHASRDPFDALQYAPGATLCLVECDGIVTEHDDKLVCRRRRIVARCDATEGLQYFARIEAIKALEFWADPSDAVLDYLMTGDSGLRSAARSAAESAARSAAESAAPAWSAAWSAAESAAWSAARSAARSAAWSAAESAAWSAAESAAWSASRADWNALVFDAFRDFLGEV